MTALVDAFEKKQYPRMKEALQNCDISLHGVPSFADIKKALQPQILESAAKLKDPLLLLTPPLNRRALLDIWDRNYSPGRRRDSRELRNNLLWNGGTAKIMHWEVDIVESAQNGDVEDGAKQKCGRWKKPRSDVEYLRFFKREYAKQGLQIMSGARKYIALIMRMVEEGQARDFASYTVLNGNAAQSQVSVALGSWDRDNYNISFLSGEKLDMRFDYIDVRPSISVIS